MSGQSKTFPNDRLNTNHDEMELFAILQADKINEKKLTDILIGRSASQRKEISTRYKYMFGEHLEGQFATKLTGEFKETIIALTKDAHELKARALYNALQEQDVDSQTLIQIMIATSNEELRSLKQTYRKRFGAELELDIESKISGHFGYILKLLLQGKREKILAIGNGKLAEEIYLLSMSIEKWDMPKEVLFTYILCSRSFQHIKALAKVYLYKSKETLIETIKRETSGPCCKTLVSIVQYALDPLGTYAKWIQESIQAGGTRDRDLIRLIITRAEIDIEDIKEEFQRMTGKTLSSTIRTEVSGSYKDALIAIVEGSKHT